MGAGIIKSVLLGVICYVVVNCDGYTIDVCSHHKCMMMTVMFSRACWRFHRRTSCSEMLRTRDMHFGLSSVYLHQVNLWVS